MDAVGGRPGRVIRAAVAGQGRTARASRRRCGPVVTRRGGGDAAHPRGQQQSCDGCDRQGGGLTRGVRGRFVAGRRRRWQSHSGRAG